MAATAQQLAPFVLAQFAAESYLDGVVGSSPELLSRRLRLGSNSFAFVGDTNEVSRDVTLTGYTRLTDLQIGQFAARYDVVDHLPNTITGFSATLLWDKLDNRYVLSFRSTEYPNEDEGGDWRRDGLVGADGEIGHFGFAYAQIADMEAYYQQIVKPLITDPASGIIGNFAVTGYSLGGHLATVFAEAHQTDPGFLQAYTFNAPGRAAISGDMAALVSKAYQELSAPGVDALLRSGVSGESIYNTDNFYAAANGIRATLQTFAGNPSGVSITAEGVAQNLAGGKIVQVFGRADTDDSTWVANSGVHSSNKVELFIEDQPNVQGLGPITVLDGLTGVRSDFGSTHSITLVADTLAVMTVLQKLTPALMPEAMKAIFSLASNERGIGFVGSSGRGESDSLERIVEALFPILEINLAQFLTDNNVPTPDDRLPRGLAGGGFGNWANRNVFYAALERISTAASNAANYQIEALVDKSVADIITAAEETSAKGIAYRYALKQGSPFAVIRDEALYATHNTGANAGALDLNSANNPTGALTAAWIQNRTDFLTRLNYYNNQNARYDLIKASENPNTLGDATATQYDSENIVWDDRTRNVLIRRGDETGAAYRVFGSDTADALNGRQSADRLYGSGGTDVVTGKGGADYLEGGTGLDIYEYDSARKGSMLTTSADGHDTVLDVDGKGILRYQYVDAEGNAQSTALAGVAIKEPDGKWKTADGRFVLERVGANLKVTFGASIDGSVIIRDFDFTKAAQGGYFGIRLSEARTVSQTVQPVIFGDKKYADFTEARVQQKRPDGTPLGMTQIGSDFYETPAYGALPAIWLNVRLAPATSYVLDRVEGAASYYVLPANVTLLYNEADEFGNIKRTDEDQPDLADQLYDTPGNDNILAGGGNDNIDALRSGADVISAGAGRDVVNAGTGNDLVEGGANGTVVLGLSGVVAGGDMIAGGAGDDELYGNVKITLSLAIKNGETDIAINAVGDFLSGEAGNDWIVGDKGGDALLGGAGDDILVGGAGDDNLFGDRNHTAPDAAWFINRQEVMLNYQTLFTGVNAVADGVGGRDVLYGGGGVDWAFGGKGDDFIDGGSGADVLFGDEGSDVVIGGTENDVLVGDGVTVAFEEQGADYLDGGAGNDTLQGDGGDDILIGDVGEDILSGGAGNDIFIGGKGLDQLIGGSGKDTYVFNRGDGTEIIVDTAGDAKSQEASVLVLGDGISQSDIKFRPGSLLVDLGPSNPDDPLAGNDQIHFTNFNNDFPGLTEAIGEIRFADGSSMDYADILAQGFDIDGTALDDAGGTALTGTSVTDRIRGFAGSDELEGRDGNDVLTGDGGADRLDGGNGNDALDGGTGNDLLAGGMGSDNYRFVRGDGLDSVVEGSLFVPGLSDPGHADRILFGQGITRSDVSLLRTGDGNLTVRYGAGDEILIEGQYGVPGADIESIVFADGETIDKAALDVLEIGVIDGTAATDELYGTAGNDVLRGHDGDDYLDGGPSPERRTTGTRTFTGDDVLEGGVGGDTYALYWGMGSDRIIETTDGQSNTLALLNAGTLDGVRTTRDGDDLLVTMRGNGGSARVQGFFAAGGSDTWQITSAVEGSQSLLDFHNAQSTAENPYAVDAMADYKQRLLGEWQAQSQPNLNLPTHVYINSTWSQTIAQWTTLVNALPEPVRQTVTWVNAPVTDTSIGGYGIRQGAHIVGLPLSGNTVTQRLVQPIVTQTITDDAYIAAEQIPGISANSVSYTFNAGGGGPFSNPRTYSNQNGFVTNTITESSAEGWVSLNLRSDGLGQFGLRIHQIVENPVIEDIEAGSSNNSIVGMLDSAGDRIALIDAGAGNDVVSAGQFDFAFGNDGNDRITGGAYAFGGNGFDILSDGRFIAGGADDDFLSGGEGETTFHFRSDEAGWDQVRDQNGVSLTEFMSRAGFADSLSNRVYGGKYRLGGETSFHFQNALEARFGGRSSDAYRNLFSALTYAELDLGNGETQRYAVLPSAPGFPRGITDGFFRGPYSSDGYYTWVYNSIEDMMRDFADLGLQFNPADVQQIPGVPDLSEFTADNHAALQPFFESGVLAKDTVELADFEANVDEITTGFATPGEYGDQNRVLRLLWGTDKVIDIELPSATDLIGHGIEEIIFGGDPVYIGDLVALAEEEGYLGTSFDDYLFGTDTDDRIRGLAGWDYIDGGAGNDVLSGGAGIDEFYFQENSGSDTILDPDADDLIVFGDGITPEQIQLGLGSLRLRYGPADDEIHFQGFNPDDVHGNTLFAALQFWDVAQGEELPDGSFDSIWTLTNELTYGEVLERGFDIAGTDNDDILRGTNIHDRFHDGGGNDVLAGGAGGDSYFFDRGNGADIVSDFFETGTINRIVLRDRVAEDISGTREDGQVVLRARASADEIRIQWDQAHGSGVDLVEFSDGSTWSRAILEQLPAVTVNSSPTVGIPLRPQLVLEDTAFNFALPEGSFLDPDAGDVLTYSAAQADDSPLPEWLNFDPGSGNFSGQPGNEHVGALSVKVTASDSAGASVSGFFDITVVNVNDAPQYLPPIDDQQASEDLAFSFVVPEQRFSDPDSGDALTYAARLADGSPLPDWLLFDPAARRFSGTPLNGDVGSLALKVTATDLAGSNAAGTFAVTVQNTNDAPTAVHAITDQAASENTAFGFAIPANTFLDVDAGDVLAYGASLPDGGPLPAWMAFDALTGIFSGMPPTGTAGDFALRVTATDRAGAQAFADFNLTVAAGSGGITLIGTPASESLIGTAFNDIIEGRGGNDTLSGLEGDDLLVGGTGADRLLGGKGDDILDGRRGNDTLKGGKGADTYLFGRGGGKDIIDDDGAAGDLDTVLFGDGITLRDLRFAKNDGDLTISINGTNDRLTIRDWSSRKDGIETLRFANGQAIDLREVMRRSHLDHGRDEEGGDTHHHRRGGERDGRRNHDASGKQDHDHAGGDNKYDKDFSRLIDKWFDERRHAGDAVQSWLDESRDGAQAIKAETAAIRAGWAASEQWLRDHPRGGAGRSENTGYEEFSGLPWLSRSAFESGSGFGRNHLPTLDGHNLKPFRGLEEGFRALG